MKRGTPLRRTGFKRQARPAAAHAPLMRQQPVPGRIVRMAAINGAEFRGGAPKSEPQRNSALLAMARGQRCLLQVPGTCTGDPATTVACHSNQSVHGKAGTRKADDQWHVYGCNACHRWLDQGPAPAVEKVERFSTAHRWMVAIWQDIVAGMQPATPRERRAAEWALARIERGENTNG